MSSFYPGVTVGDLVPGDPSSLRDLASRLGVLGSGLSDAASELQSIFSGQWTGAAADAFRNVIHQQPGRYQTAGWAFETSSRAISNFSDALEETQRSAQTAITQYGDGSDPTAASSAESTLNAAADSLLSAHQTLISTLAEAENAAPSHPSLLSEVVGGIAGIVGEGFHLTGQFIEGVWDGTTAMIGGVFDLAKLAWEFSPERMMLDPLGWFHSVEDAGHTIETIGDYAIHHPLTFGKKFGEALLNWNEWSHDPAKAFGELVPAIVLAVATAGVGSAADGAMDTATTLDDASATMADASDALAESADSTRAVAAVTDFESPGASDSLWDAANSFDDAAQGSGDVANNLQIAADAYRAHALALKEIKKVSDIVSDIQTGEDIATDSKNGASDAVGIVSEKIAEVIMDP